MTHAELDELYQGFAAYAWRLEARDIYGIPEDNARLQAWLAGREVPRSEPKDTWGDLTAAAAADGRPFSRVRMVGRPLTDYTRWEHSLYPENLAAGEDVRLLDRDWLTAVDQANPLWDVDFWLFDDQTAVIQRYDADGGYLGPSLAPDPAPFVTLRARALQLPVPFVEYTLLPPGGGAVPPA